MFATEDHEVEVVREHADGSETVLKCLVQITCEGSKWSGWKFAAVDVADVGELPDGNMAHLDEGEIEQLQTLAADIELQTRADLEAAALNRAGGED